MGDRIAALTFDDGTRWQPEFIRSLGIPVTLFLPTGWVGSDPDRFMSWAEAVGLHAEGHEVGSHGHDHANWVAPGFDHGADILRSLRELREHGLDPVAFAPPWNKWYESETIRGACTCGRKGEGQLLLDRHRIMAKGLSRLTTGDVQQALGWGAEYGWSVYVAHLYADPVWRSREEAVVREVVRRGSDLGIRWVSFTGVALRFMAQLGAYQTKCPICAGGSFDGFREREHAKCSRCGALERHRALAWYLQNRAPRFGTTTGAPVVLVSSGELTRVFQSAGYSVRHISPYQPPPRNDVQNMHGIDDGTAHWVLLQHVLPQVEDDRKALLEVARILHPRGRALIEHPLFEDYPTWPGKGPFVRHYGRADWEALAQEFFIVEDRVALIPKGTLYVCTRKP